MTDQTKAALVAFQNHVLDILASNPAKRHSPKVAAIDIDRFLAAHRTELAIKDGTFDGEVVGQPKMIPISGDGNHGGLDDGNARFLTSTCHPDICKER